MTASVASCRYRIAPSKNSTAWKTNPERALAVITRILEHMFGDRSDARSDPFYEDPDYITEFFTTVKEFQVSLVVTMREMPRLKKDNPRRG